MSLHAGLLKQAKHLAAKEPRRPQQASLRRAVSASYYALFHMLVDDATRLMLPGRARHPLRDCLARAFQHAAMRKVAQQFSTDTVSQRLGPGLTGQRLQAPLVAVATTFVDLQEARHEADYDRARRFTRREVLDLVDRVDQAFHDWPGVRRTVQADTFLTGLLIFGRIHA